MQAAAQKWVDSSISKTINVPEDIGFEAFKDVYMKAYETGLQGLHDLPAQRRDRQCAERGTDTEKPPIPFIFPKIRRGGRRRGQSPLQVGRATSSTCPNRSTGRNRWRAYLQAEMARQRARDLHHDQRHRPHGHRRPFEIFINSKNMEHFAWTVALTRMISAVFRRGGDVSFVVEELKAVFDPRGGAWMKGKYVPSILAAIGGVIERHLISIGFIDGEGMGLKTDPQAEVVNLGVRPDRPGPAVNTTCAEGCPCANCGHSRPVRHAHDRMGCPRRA
jgi:ribonucleoside-diphosphate reductase alpha chain